jgi:hypothetical protein
MIVHRDIEQGTLAWHLLRLGKPTASEFSNILTPKFEERKGEMPFTYLAQKVAEAYRTKPLPSPFTFEMEQGEILEDEARSWLELENDLTVDQVTFIETDDKRMGCSPDGLIGEDGGLELKCPQPKAHIKYLMRGTLPDEYATQVHGCMFITGRKWWNFLSYHRHFPPFLLKVERDESIIQKIESAVTNFCGRIDVELKKLRQ